MPSLVVSMNIIWLIAMVVLLIVEGLAPGLVSIWFALGALAALICSLLGAPVWLQILWFFVVSIAALVLTRPLAKKYVNSRVVPTNADIVIGKEGLVTEDINNVLGTGAVTVLGKVWTARSLGDANIPAGSTVKILRIEGVKLIVEEK